MIDPSIDLKQLNRAIAVLKKSDVLIAPEFVTAGKQFTDYAVKDLRRGVPKISSELAQGITGEVKSVSGINQTNQFGAGARGSTVDYAWLLDRKSGRRVWRSGKFAGQRTFGWFTNVLPRLAKKWAKKYYTIGLEKAVAKMVGRIGK